MTTVNVYLTFDGNCKAAFDFYKTVFGKEFRDYNTFAEMPPQDGMPPMPEEMKDRIMHVSLPVSEQTTLMGSDTGGEWGQGFQMGNNFSISVNTSSTEEADRIFNSLSKEGVIKQIPFTGYPFLVAGMKRMECSHGKDRDKERKLKRKLEASTVQYFLLLFDHSATPFSFIFQFHLDNDPLLKQLKTIERLSK